MMNMLYVNKFSSSLLIVATYLYYHLSGLLYEQV